MILIKAASQKRFPNDFMFAMNKYELGNWRSQFATSKEDRQGLRYTPFCFTEQGITMLSYILNSYHTNKKSN